MMQSLSCLALALLQQDLGGIESDVHLMMIAVWIIVGAIGLVFLAAAVAGARMFMLVRKVEEIADKADSKIWPMVDKTQALVDNLGPKMASITTNVEQISYTVRGKVDEFSATADEINQTLKDVNKRTQAHVARVDEMVNEAVHTAHHVSRTVQEGVRKPVQQIAGIVAAVRRGVETWVERMPFKREAAAQPESYRAYDAPASYAAAQANPNRPYD